MEASRAEGAEERKPFLDLGRLQKSEYVGFVSAIVLLISLFLPWFSTIRANGSINGTSYPNGANAFEIFFSLDWLLVAACSAPFILAYIIARGHSLSWRPGEVTAIVGLIAVILILYNGVIGGKPGGAAPGTVGFEIGYPIALVGAVGIVVSGFIRQLAAATRKPPGV